MTWWLRSVVLRADVSQKGNFSYSYPVPKSEILISQPCARATKTQLQSLQPPVLDTGTITTAVIWPYNIYIQLPCV